MSDQPTTAGVLDSLRAALLRDERREAQSAELWRMSAEQRVAAMNAGRLSLDQLSEWSRRAPDEVPRIGNEFAWIVWTTPEWAEAPLPKRRGNE